jgi:hypothetical protein
MAELKDLKLLPLTAHERATVLDQCWHPGVRRLLAIHDEQLAELEDLKKPPTWRPPRGEPQTIVDGDDNAFLDVGSVFGLAPTERSLLAGAEHDGEATEENDQAPE